MKVFQKLILQQIDNGADFYQWHQLYKIPPKGSKMKRPDYAIHFMQDIGITTEGWCLKTQFSQLNHILPDICVQNYLRMS
jgi:hypothetical protein